MEIKDRRPMLRVKIKSLAYEAKIIRSEERKSKLLKQELADHRRGIVRYEARHALLAYTFLKGKKYKDVEPNARTKPNKDKILKLISKYGRFNPEDYRDNASLVFEDRKNIEKWLTSTDK